MKAESPLPIALIDDHTLVRKGLIELIHQTGGYRVVMEAGNGQEFIEGLDAHPEVCMAIVDLNMPVMDGYATIAWINVNRPELRTLALTFGGGEEAMVRAIRNGARGFILKDVEPEELKLALDQIRIVGYYHTDLVQESLVNNVDKLHTYERQRAQVLASISPREMDLLRFLCSADEPTYEEVATMMDVHRRTVDGYREALLSKFRLRSKTGLVLFAVKWGIVKL